MQQNGTHFVASSGLHMPETPTLIVVAEPASVRHTDGEGGPLKLFSTLSATLNRVIESGLPILLVCDDKGALAAQGLLPQASILHQTFVSGNAADQLVEALVAGVQAHPNAGGWLALPCAIPMIQPATLRLVAEALKSYPVAYAEHRQQQGYPIGFSSELFSELMQVGSFRDLDRVIVRYPSYRVEVDDPGVLLAPEGLQRSGAYIDARRLGMGLRRG